MTVAYLSIGSNIDDRLYHLAKAVQALHSHDGVEVLAVSSVYETAPVGYTDQSDFLNVTVCVETVAGAHELLEICQGIERELGRVRTIRWGPRTVDLDILLYGNDNIETENLVVPHPRMHERAFVLIPLLEIAPFIANPTAPRKLFSEEAAVRDSGVILWKKVDGVEHFLQLKE
jgi:2-amino-4-hydroxy-6-hydroxymethyldihydropteridine diphosphokinase